MAKSKVIIQDVEQETAAETVSGIETWVPKSKVKSNITVIKVLDEEKTEGGVTFVKVLVKA